MAKVEIEEVQGRPAMVIDYRTPIEEIGGTMSEAFAELMHELEVAGAHPVGAPFAVYPEMEPDALGQMRVLAGIPVAAPVPERGRLRSSEVPSGLTATITHIGSYDQLPDAYVELEAGVEREGYEPAGPIWEEYLTDPHEQPDPSTWRTLVHVPVAPHVPPD